MTAFKEDIDKLLDGLNPEQKKAANTIEGPVQVIAGPGTGKTQILATRIANILSKTDAQPNNILCLTYTEAGVVAMRKRLISVIGPTAHQVEIHTFHSLCNQVIQDFPHKFGATKLSPLDDIEKEQVMKKVCESIPSESPLYNSFDPYTYQYDLQNMFGEFKKENLSYARVKRIGETELAALKNDEKYIYGRSGKGYKKGDFNEKKYLKDAARIQKVMEAARLLDVYQDLLESKQRYDYQDMILWVLEAFTKDADLLAVYQEQFLYVLVDEFQDTNAAQFGILELLMAHWESPNIFSVGDDDQSIFAFQGANVKNMQSFGSKFSAGLNKYVLQTNYRSTPEILELAKTSIGNNTMRLSNLDEAIDKNLQAYKPSKNNQPQLRAFKNALQEAHWIADKIEDLTQSGVDAKNIGVIYTKHKLVEPLRAILESKEIDFELRLTASVFDSSAVKFLYQALGYIARELQKPFSADHELFMLLHAPCFGLDSLALAEKYYGISRKKEKNKFMRYAFQQEQPDFFNQAPIGNAMRSIENWVQFAAQNSPLVLLNKILLESNLLKLYEKPGDNYEDINALETFFRFVQSRNEKNTKYDLSICLYELDILQQNGGLKVQQSIQSDNGVNLMSAHGSKGLEFEHVFVLGCNANQWEKKRNTAKIQLKYLFPELGVEDDEEVRRLFYVALTRAEDHLYLSYCNESESGKEQSESVLISEIRQSEALQEVGESLQKEGLAGASLAQIIKLPVVPIQKRDEDLIKRALENYVLSASHLNSYISCPIAFYYEKVLRVPGSKPEAVVAGNAVHGALEMALNQFNRTGALPNAEQVTQFAETYLTDNKIHFSAENFKNKVAYTKSYLNDYYQSRQPLWSLWQNIHVEKPVRAFYQDVPLKGFMDVALLDADNYVRFIDFKTGNPKNALGKLKPPQWDYTGDDLKKKYGGDYWRQMLFYYILVDYSTQNNWKVKTAAVSCIEKEKESGRILDDFVLEATREERDFIGKLIKDVYGKIMNHEFQVGCGNTNSKDKFSHYCMWCDYEQNGW